MTPCRRQFQTAHHSFKTRYNFLLILLQSSALRCFQQAQRFNRVPPLFLPSLAKLSSFSLVAALLVKFLKASFGQFVSCRAIPLCLAPLLASLSVSLRGTTRSSAEPTPDVRGKSR